MQPDEFTNIPSTFNIPDLRGRVIIGPDNMGGNNAGVVQNLNDVGVKGGSETHVLIEDELPQSNIQVPTWQIGSSNEYGPGFLYVPNGSTYRNSSNTPTMINMYSSGGDQPHNNNATIYKYKLYY